MNTKVEDYIEPAKSQISDTVSQVQNRVCDTAKKASYATDRYVRDNPWQTIAMVAIAAGVIGWLLRSSRD